MLWREKKINVCSDSPLSHFLPVEATWSFIGYPARDDLQLQVSVGKFQADHFCLLLFLTHLWVMLWNYEVYYNYQNILAHLSIKLVISCKKILKIAKTLLRKENNFMEVRYNNEQSLLLTRNRLLKRIKFISQQQNGNIACNRWNKFNYGKWFIHKDAIFFNCVRLYIKFVVTLTDRRRNGIMPCKSHVCHYFKLQRKNGTREKRKKYINML